MKEVDYLIVGQGLAGTLLSYNLIKDGKDILVLDSGLEITSSKIAAGIYNPITGRRMVKTWMADTLFPFLENYYAELEQFLNTRFLFKKPVFRPFESLADQNYWYGQSADEAFKNYIQLSLEIPEIEKHYHAPFGGFETQNSGYIHVNALLYAFQNYLLTEDKLLRTEFAPADLVSTEKGIGYKEIKAKGIIFCEGFKAKSSPLFSYLPIEGTKGQILDVLIEDYALESIVNKRVFVLPESTHQRVGSTYDRDFKDETADETATAEITAKLEAVLKSPYKILNKKAALRPTTVDRRPLLGKHPKLSNTYIFNGLGTKGVSLAPFFSTEMLHYLIHDKPLMKEVDIQRFDYLYL